MSRTAAPDPCEGAGSDSGGGFPTFLIGRFDAPGSGSVRSVDRRGGRVQVSVSARAEVPDLPEDGVEFVRFCRSRRRVSWPELYDEMCDVARRRLFRGWGFDELAQNGVEFGLFQMGTLAAVTRRIVAEEAEARAAAAEAHAARTGAPDGTAASAA